MQGVVGHCSQPMGALRFHWDFTGVHSDFTEISLRLHWDFIEISLRCTEISLRFHWYFTEIFLRCTRFHWDFTEISLRFHWGALRFHWDVTEITLRCTQFSLRCTLISQSFHWDVTEISLRCTQISLRFHWAWTIFMATQSSSNSAPRSSPLWSPRSCATAAEFISAGYGYFSTSSILRRDDVSRNNCFHTSSKYFCFFACCSRKYNLGKAWGTPGELFDLPWGLHDEKS